MERLKVDLLSGDGHEVSNPDLYIFCVVDIEVGHFHGCDFPVKSVEDGGCETFLAFSPDVQVGECEKPGTGGSISEVVEVWCVCDESHSDVGAPENQCLSSCHPKVLVVRRDLLSANKLQTNLERLHSRVVRFFVKVIVRVDICLLGGPLDIVTESRGGRSFLLEGLKVGGVLFLEFGVCLGGNGRSGKSEERHSYHDLVIIIDDQINVISKFK